MHFDGVSLIQYLRRILAILRTICICVTDNSILGVIFLSLWTLVYSGLDALSIVYDVSWKVVQQLYLGHVRTYPLIDRIDVLLREKAYFFATLLSLSLDLCCIKISARYGFNASWYFRSFSVLRNILRLFHEVDTIVRAHFFIAHVILEDRDCYGLVECVQLVWFRVLVGGIQGRWWLCENGIVKLVIKVHGHHAQEGYDEEERAAAAKQRIEGLLALVRELDWHGKQVLPSNCLQYFLH